MTSTSERRLVFLDATVLAAPTTRSLLLFGQLHRDARYRACWSLEAETEADTALMRRSDEMHGRLGRTISPVLVSDLRRRTVWGADVLVPSAPEVAESLGDTHTDDRHILAAAAAASARLIVTVDVDDFGRADLSRLGISVVNPDVYMARVMTESMYRFTLERLAGHRTLAPNTPEAIHESLARVHPRLVAAMRTVYPGAEPPTPTDASPRSVFRGDRCIVCGRRLTGAESLAGGVGPECRQSHS